MKSRKPAVFACVVLALAVISLPVAWLWHRWDTEWLRPEADFRVPMAADEAVLVVRVDGLKSGDPRLDDVRNAYEHALPDTLGILEGHVHSRQFPRLYHWFGVFLKTAEYSDAFAVEYRKRLSEELKLQGTDVRCRVGVVRGDGKILTAD